jgi:hypothetical protein
MKYLKFSLIIFILLRLLSDSICFSSEERFDKMKKKRTIKMIGMHLTEKFKPKMNTDLHYNCNIGFSKRTKILIKKVSLKELTPQTSIKRSSILFIGSNENKIIVNPLPAKGNVNIQLFVDISSDAEIKIFSINGTELINMRTKLIAGLNDIVLNINTLSEGVYYCIVKHGTRIENCKIVVF